MRNAERSADAGSVVLNAVVKSEEIVVNTCCKVRKVNCCVKLWRKVKTIVVNSQIKCFFRLTPDKSFPYEVQTFPKVLHSKSTQHFSIGFLHMSRQTFP